MSNNGTQANGAVGANVQNNVPVVYSLLNAGEDVNSQAIQWLERFTTFLQRAEGHPTWAFNEIDKKWTVQLFVNQHLVNDFVGRGNTKKAAKIDLVKQLQMNQNNLLWMPLLPQYQIGLPMGGDPIVDGALIVDGVSSTNGTSSDESSTPDNETSS